MNAARALAERSERVRRDPLCGSIAAAARRLARSSAQNLEQDSRCTLARVRSQTARRPQTRAWRSRRFGWRRATSGPTPSVAKVMAAGADLPLLPGSRLRKHPSASGSRILAGLTVTSRCGEGPRLGLGAVDPVRSIPRVCRSQTWSSTIKRAPAPTRGVGRTAIAADSALASRAGYTSTSRPSTTGLISSARRTRVLRGGRARRSAIATIATAVRDDKPPYIRLAREKSWRRAVVEIVDR